MQKVVGTRSSWWGGVVGMAVLLAGVVSPVGPVAASASPLPGSAALRGPRGGASLLAPSNDPCAVPRRVTWLGGRAAVAESLVHVDLGSSTAVDVAFLGLNPTELAVSPDGVTVAAVAEDDRGGDGRRRVWLGPLDGSTAPVALAPVDASHVSWSPSGDRLAVTTASSVAVLTAVGAPLAEVPLGSAPEVAPSWSTDGTRLAVVTKVTDAAHDVSVVAAAGDGPVTVLPTQLTGPVGPPQWTASGELAYIGPSRHVVVSPSDGSAAGATILGDPSTAVAPVLASPDGTRIAWTGELTFGGRQHVFVAPGDGSAAPFSVTALAGTTGSSQPAWSPDGTRLAVRTKTAATAAVEEVDAVAGAPRTTIDSLGTVDAWGAGPVWSPDGSTLGWSRYLPFADRAVMTAPSDGSAPATTVATDASLSGAGLGLPKFGSSSSLLYRRQPAVPSTGYRLHAVVPGVASIGESVTTLSGSLAISPDGRHLAWVRNDAGLATLVTAAGDGSDQHTLPLGAVHGADELTPQFAPDGSRLALVVVDNLSSQLVVIAAPVDGAAPPVVLSTGVSFASTPLAWSPDSGHVAFVGKGSTGGSPTIYVSAADGSGRVALPGATADTGEPTFSPDGTTVAFTGAGALWAVPGDGSGAAVKLGALAAPTATPVAQRPAWSPDGRFIAFNALDLQTSGPYTTTILHSEEQVISATGGNPVVLPGGGPASWSPGGARLAFPSGTPNPSGSLLIVRPDGSDGHAVRGPANSSGSAQPRDLRWSPDGHELLWTREDTHSIEHWSLDAPDAVDVWATSMVDPAWSPDGRQVAAYAWARGNVLLSRTGPPGLHDRFNLDRDSFAKPPRWSTVGNDTACGDGPAAAYHAVTPVRILDSRTDIGGWSSPLGAGEARTLPVAGTAGVPVTATAAVLAVTVTGGSAPSYLSAFPSAATPPVTANLLFAPGQTVTNLATVGLGSGGAVELFNQQGSVDVVADLVGWYDDGSQTASADGAWFHPMTPTRVLDSREPTDPWGDTPLQAGSSHDLTIAGHAGVPSDATAVTANVTVTGGTAASFLRAWPAGVAEPDTASVLFAPGQTVATAAVLPLGTDGAVSLSNQIGDVDLVVDVTGWYAPGPGGAGFRPMTPARLVDSRDSAGPWGAAPLGPGATRSLLVGGSAAIPPSAVAVVGNLTATGGTAASYIALGPTPGPVTTTASLLFAPGQTIPNQVTVGLGQGRTIDLFNQLGHVDLVLDAAGYFTWR